MLARPPTGCRRSELCGTAADVHVPTPVLRQSEVSLIWLTLTRSRLAPFLPHSAICRSPPEWHSAAAQVRHGTLEALRPDG